MTRTTTASRAVQAAQSAGRAAGYCWLEHPNGGGHCTRPPHADNRHVDHYNGRTSETDSSGFVWQA